MNGRHSCALPRQANRQGRREDRRGGGAAAGKQQRAQWRAHHLWALPTLCIATLPPGTAFAPLLTTLISCSTIYHLLCCYWLYLSTAGVPGVKQAAFSNMAYDGGAWHEAGPSHVPRSVWTAHCFAADSIWEQAFGISSLAHAAGQRATGWKDGPASGSRH